MLLAPYYRTYELPWEGDPESAERFRRILRIGLVLLLILGILFPLLPAPKRAAIVEPIPPRLARVMIEQQRKPPPPPPVPELAKPELPPQPKPTPIKPPPAPVDRTQQARERAQEKMQQFKDELADLREQLDLTPLKQSQNLSAAVGADSRAERSLITAGVGQGSSGINTAATGSRGFGKGSGSLSAHTTSTVTSSIAAQADSGPTRTGNSKKAARSREEIELVFDRYKGALYALHSRAVREQPDLQGKMVIEFTVAPSGEVTMCRVVSSELNNPDFETKIITRIRAFRFEARDVEAITVTKPIDFFPA
jgi:periplasmic protein TonB